MQIYKTEFHVLGDGETSVFPSQAQEIFSMLKRVSNGNDVVKVEVCDYGQGLHHFVVELPDDRKFVCFFYETNEIRELVIKDNYQIRYEDDGGYHVFNINTEQDYQKCLRIMEDMVRLLIQYIEYPYSCETK